MALDHCVPTEPGSRRRATRAPRGATRWSARSAGASAARRRARRADQALFGIVQGGADAGAAARERARDRGAGLRRLRARRARSRRGAARCARSSSRRATPSCRAAAPRYLMGLGKPEDLVLAVDARRRPLRLRRADAERPPRRALHEPRPRSRSATRASARIPRRPTRAATALPARGSRAPTCATSSRAATSSGRASRRLHNLCFYYRLLAGARAAIAAGASPPPGRGPRRRTGRRAVGKRRARSGPRRRLKSPTDEADPQPGRSAVELRRRGRRPCRRTPRSPARARRRTAAASLMAAGGAAVDRRRDAPRGSARLDRGRGFVAAAVGVAVWIDRMVWNTIAGPVQKVLEAIERVAAGDFAVRVTAAELGPLAALHEHAERALRPPGHALARGHDADRAAPGDSRARRSRR